jgi:hypothetical protein
MKRLINVAAVSYIDLFKECDKKSGTMVRYIVLD